MVGPTSSENERTRKAKAARKKINEWEGKAIWFNKNRI